MSDRALFKAYNDKMTRRPYKISESNFELLQKYYSFDDYDLFYNENFSDIPEPDIESIFMDEPILIEGIDQAEEEEDY